MRVDIFVNGRAILYLDRTHQAWYIVFITDECHKAIFTGPSGIPEVLATTFPRTITFSGGAGAPTPPVQSVVNEFLNLSLEILHGVREVNEGEEPKSNLDVSPDLSNGHQYVRLVVPYGSLSVVPPRSGIYFIEPHGSGLPRSLGRGVATKFCISFDAPQQLTMTIDNNGVPEDRNYPTAANAITLGFDNDCLDEKSANDFIDIYDWVSDINSTSDNEIKFVAGKILEYPISDTILPVDAGGARFRGNQGDCDPVIIEPPPGP